MEQQINSPLESRLWRPAAQRRVRNAWSSIFAELSSWTPVSAKGLSIATALVNALLSTRYLPSLNLGALHDMPDIRKKVHQKLRYQQEAYSDQLVGIYNDLVKTVLSIIEASRSMRTYLKGPINSPLVEFSGDQKLNGDVGDGGGVAVFRTLSVQSFETFAKELVVMFVLELNVKWILASKMHSAVWPNKEFDCCELHKTLMKAIGSTNVFSSEVQHLKFKVIETSNRSESGRGQNAHLRPETLQDRRIERNSCRRNSIIQGTHIFKCLKDKNDSTQKRAAPGRWFIMPLSKAWLESGNCSLPNGILKRGWNQQKDRS